MATENLISSKWQPVAEIPVLRAGGVQVWRVDLPVTSSFLEACRRALTPDEDARAARRKHGGARLHSIVGRGVLRFLLAANTGYLPAEISLTAGANGKPLADGISFNVAHSGGMILIALQGGGAVGVDVEEINDRTHFMDIAERCFTPGETASLAAISGEQERRGAFYRLWTRKESIVKADGRGLMLPLNSFEAKPTVSIPQDGSAATKDFRLHELVVSDAFAASLATDDLSAIPRLFLFPGR